MSIITLPVIPQLGEDRIVREAERKVITSISRAQAYQLEKVGRFPKRIVLGNRSVGWLYSDLQAWLKARKDETLGIQQQ